MTASPHADVDSETHTRIRQQEVVVEFGQQAPETDDPDQLMHDAAVAVAEERFSGPELLTSHDVVSGISVVIGSVENP